MGKGCSWVQRGWKGPGGQWEGKPRFMELAQLREEMASGNEGALGRLGARCEDSGTAGTDRGETGKRDRQRVPGGKCRVRLSLPRKASGIRPG